MIDEYTRECLAIDVAGGIRSSRVIEVLSKLISVHGAPKVLRSDYGPEFASKAILKWLAKEKIDTAFIEPGKPWQNGSNDDRPTEDLHREARSDDTYQSGTDPESHRNRKSQAAPAQPSYLGHVFTDSQHGRVVILRANRGEEDVERKIAAQLLADVAEPVKRITIGADKAHDTGGFVRARRPMNVTPHVAQNTRRKAPPAKSKT